MLVLTRKTNEQILIGDDIKITVVRLRGNTVRIGIEAPGDKRILRGELEPMEIALPDELDSGPQITRREEAFAHPQPERKAISGTQTNRLPAKSETQVFVGKVNKSGQDAVLKPAPLAGFVAAV